MMTDLFAATAPSTSLIGLAVLMPSDCPACGARAAVLGSSRAMHHAAIRCAECDRHRGWVSAAFAAFVGAILDEFGRPTAPIILRSRGGP
jgi:hypothetical protein